MIPSNYSDPADPRDAWALSSATYDLDNFYCWSRDSKGFSVNQQVRMTPSMQAQLHMLANDPDLPYRSVHDVIRDAVQHRLHWIIDQQRTRNTALWEASRDELVIEEQAKLREHIANRQNLVRSTWETLQECQSAGLTNKAHETVDTFEDVVMGYEHLDERRVGMEHVAQMRHYMETGLGAPSSDANVTVLAGRRSA